MTEDERLKAIEDEARRAVAAMSSEAAMLEEAAKSLRERARELHRQLILPILTNDGQR